MDEFWVAYLETPAGNNIEYQSWPGELHELITAAESKGFKYLKHNVITGMVNFRGAEL